MRTASIVETRRARQLAIRQARPLATIPEIAAALETSEATVKADLKYLRSSNLLSEVSLPRLGGKQFEKHFTKFYVFIETSYRPTESELKTPDHQYQARVRDELGRLLREEDCGAIIPASIDIVVGGVFDIVVRLYAKRMEDVHRFVTERVRVMPHVLRTSTAWSLDP